VSDDRFLASSPIDASSRALYDWHLRPGAFDRLNPPWERVEVDRRDGPIAEGDEVVLRVPVGPFRLKWVAVHRDFVDGRQFRDVQRSGPFARWVHTHRTLPEGDRSILQDEIEYRLPLGFLGRLFGGAFTRAKLTRLFSYRHVVTAGDLQRHERYADRPRMTVAITGASGLVGSALTAFLTTGGHRVLRLVRRPSRGEGEVAWDPAKGTLEAHRLEGIDAVVHLGGANIAAGRWNAERKAAIRDSRIDGTRFLAESLASLDQPPRVLVNASAIGYYGDRGDEALDESSPPGEGFLPETCIAWERSTTPAVEAGLRVVLVRIGIVLTPAGGALSRMLIPFSMGLGGRLGDGRQSMSWIGLDDLVGVLHRALQDDSLRGPVNAVAPEAVSNAEFTRTLGRVLRRPTPFPAPAFAIRTALGEMGQALLLDGARVRPTALLEAGFDFRHGALEDALRFETGRLAAPPPGLEIRF
jgi:uncharacterized protein (TIGR01777 family)